ncbi:MAG: hypothetical protein LBT39_04270 [Treponema sp.]|jgi:hypothetical protein|nr:hypothetical protein [Treponema sp.]
MTIQKLKGTFFCLGVFLLSTACNQLDIVLPSTGTYQVNALINQASLDECSVIADGDAILPYFANPVADDPDLANLVIYLQDTGGTTVGSKVRYTIDFTVPKSQAEGLTENPEDAVVIVHVANFTGELPPFPLPGEMQIGLYTLVFEIRGKQDVLSKVNRPVYYIGDREFAPEDIRCYLPGRYGNSHLVPQGLTVLLETRVSFSADLDPYIVWYNGNQRIGNGLVSAGASRLLWKAPQQTGFHTIRAELFPFKPTASQRGKIRELSLPVSAKSEEAESSSASTEDFLYRYQFAGDLLDSQSGIGLKREPALQNAVLSWYPAEQVYGLVLGKNDTYETTLSSFEIPKTTGGDLRFLIHFIPLAQGTIFTAILGSATNPLTVTLSLAEEALLLGLKSREQESATSKSLEKADSEPTFIDAKIHVEIQDTRVRAYFEPFTSFIPTDPSLPDQAEILLTEPVSGELRSWLGNRVVSEEQIENTNTAMVVVDDFAALFQKITLTDSDPLTIGLLGDPEAQ